MQVVINNRRVTINPTDIIGQGGEGIVAKLNTNQAVKVYHTPTPERSEKLAAFFAGNWHLPTGRLALPLEPVYNSSGSLIVGFTMPLLTNVEDAAAFSNKKARTALGLNNKQAVQTFIDAYTSLEKVHLAGFVVGDLSDLNIQFRGTQMFWIDIDAWQFGAYACPVATTEFVDPNLYNIDFSAYPAFKPNNDWYSFAVVLFRSLLLVHPYGGNHKRYTSLQERAQKRITVFDDGVVYPKLAYPPEVLSRKLITEFEHIFKQGSRGVFPKEALDNYLNLLTQCSGCGAYYPQERKHCPVCSKETAFVMHTPVIEQRGVKAVSLLQTTGTIAYTKVQNDLLYTVCIERGLVNLHIMGSSGGSKVVNIPIRTRTARFVIAGSLLAVNPTGTEELVVFDISGPVGKQVQTTVTDMFSIGKRAAFSTGLTKIYRIVGGTVMSIEVNSGRVLERQIHSSVKNQTWFSANGQNTQTQVFGFSNIIKDQLYWYCLGNATFEPRLPKLQAQETMLDISVKFSGNEVLIRRKTQFQGEDYLYTDIVSEQGEVIFSNRVKLENAPSKNIHGTIYSSGILLHPTDQGIVQEKVAEGRLKTFSQTEKFVAEGMSLHKFGNGLVVVGTNTATYLELR